MSDPASDRQLLRVLGPLSATTVVVGSIIGSGIFFKANVIAQHVGQFDRILAVWIVCGLISLLGALATAELGAMLPRAGGQYVYLREAFGPATGFLWGWAEFWVMRAGSVAVLAVAFAQAICGKDNVWSFRSLAIGAIVLLTAVNYVGTRWGGMMQNVTTVIKAGTLAGIMVLPFLTGAADSSLFASVVPRRDPLNVWVGIAAAMTAVAWSYDGWGNIGPVAEEVRDPQRNVPLALTLGMAIVILLYVGATIAYHLVLPLEDIAQSDFVAGSAFDRMLGRHGRSIAAAAVMISTFGALNANLLTGQRVMFAMARDRLFLPPFARVHPMFRTPHVAIVAMSGWAVLLILGSDLLKNVSAPTWLANLPAWLGDPLTKSLNAMSTKAIYDVLTDFVVFGAFVFYLLSVVAVFVLRIRRPDLPRPYKTFGYPVLPAIFVLAAGAFLYGMLLTSPVESVIGLVFVLSGIVVYRFRPRAADASR